MVMYEAKRSITQTKNKEKNTKLCEAIKQRNREREASYSDYHSIL